MIKYKGHKVVLSEIPDEITLAINIANCPYSCDGCHSPYLKEDTGEELNSTVISELINTNSGITCICLMGGDRNPKELEPLFKIIKDKGLKTAWFSGSNTLSDISLENIDFLKVGSYNKILGGLTSKTTNQRFFKNITHKFYES